MTRWKAFSIHLAISATIAISSLVLMLIFWYAPPFFASAGGKQVFLIMLGVDATLGPLITLIIYNKLKSRKALLFDFVVIGMLQFSALAYGVNVMFHGRPVYVVFIKDSFDMVLANQLSAADIEKAKPPYRSLPITGPVYVYSAMPSNINDRNEVVFAAFSGKDLPLFPQHYQTYAGHESEVAAAAKPLGELRKINPTRIAEIDAELQSQGWVESEIGFVPLRSKFEDMAVLINKRNGSILKMLKMRPW
jgi:hypothetical protein